MVTTTAVALAYRYILGREPESDEAVADLAARCQTFAELRSAFFNSEEYRAGASPAPAGAAIRPLFWRRNPVDVEVSAEDLETMLARVEHTWDALGRTELFWSVLTHDKFLSKNLDEARADEATAAFYDSGKTHVVNFRAALDRGGVDLASLSSCVEFGCGAGRVTVWLASCFAEVIGCDISRPHLDAAQRALDARGIDNAQLRLTNSIDSVRALPCFDAFFSLIALQHNPPPVALHLLEQFLIRLSPGGVAYFQIPTYRVGYSFASQAYLSPSADAPEQKMEMHVVPQKDLFALFARCGCNVLEVREDECVGDRQFVSDTFLVQKAR